MDKIAENTRERWPCILIDMIHNEQWEPRESPKEHCYFQLLQEYCQSPGFALSRNTQTPAVLPTVTLAVCLPDQRLRIVGNILLLLAHTGSAGC
jgi:hypothetical protein